MKQENGTLGTPNVYAPEAAYPRQDVYRQGINFAPREDKLPYQDYRLLGIMPLGDLDSIAAREMARTKFGPGVDVFRTGRFWCCFKVQ